MKEMQIWYCKQKSAFETIRGCSLPSQAALGAGQGVHTSPKASSSEHPFREGGQALP